MPESRRSPFAQLLSTRLPRVKPRWVVLALATAVAVMGAGTWAQRGGQSDAPANFDIRTDRDPSTAGYASRFAPAASVAELPGRRASAMAQLQRDVPNLELDFSPTLRTPEVVGVRAGFGFLTTPSPDRVGTLRAFLANYADVYGLTRAQVANLELVADYTNPAGNMSWVEFEQRINGLPVFQGLIRGGFTAQGELARTTGPLAAGLDGSSLSASPAFGAAEAVSRAAQIVNWSMPAGSLLSRGTDSLGRTRFGLGQVVDAATAWLVYFPLSPGVARLAWATEVWGDPDVFLMLLDAEDGTLLFRKNLTNYQTQSATYVVYNDDSPAPMSPSTTLPGAGTQAPYIGRTMFTLIGNEAPFTFNNLGWMTDGLNETAGNNVRAGLDLVGPDGIEATVAGVARVFNFAYDPAVEAPTSASYRNGEVTDMFYWTNLYHGRLYVLGFTEAARNFQTDNFGRGGVQNDRVNAEGQDYSGTNNANFATPSDGTSGRMQMYIFSGPTPDRTSGLDHDVLIHELTHGTSNRLHNNGAGLGTVMAGGMGEGWSDFYARALLSTADENPDGIYSTGGWVTNLLGGLTDNYYYGIRRFPYASRSNVGANGRPHNPLTFADVDPAQINTTDGAFPNSPIIANTAYQVHNVGQIWASALFEVRALYIKRLGFAVGNQRFLQFVTDGMKLDPVNPTFIQGRDAILAAAAAGGGTAADIEDIWTGFATRGVGYSAQVLNVGAGTVVEAFDVPGIKENGLMTIIAESIPNGGLDSGETVTVRLCITNTALSMSGSVTGTLLATGGVASPSGSQVYGTVAPAGNVCRDYQLIVSAACGAGLTATLQAQELGGLTRNLTYTMGVGTIGPPVVFEAFDGVTAPALPAGWSTSVIGGAANPWITDTIAPHTAPNRAFVPNPGTTTDNALVSPVIALPAGTSYMLFRNNYNTEASDFFYDGGVLEISINGGAFTDIIAAGGAFSGGGYNATIFVGDTNPLAGRQAWSGNSGGFIMTTLSLPPAAAGQNVVLRWRMGTDSIISAVGWAIDSVIIFQVVCGSQPPVITSHPQSQVAMSGNTANLSVVAGGSGTLTYQWYQGASGDTSTPVGGATSSSYTTPALVAPANYWVRVTNGAGFTNSNTAALTIGPGVGTEFVQNGSFSSGTIANWSVFEEPNIQWNVTAGVFNFWRQNPGTGSTQATIFQVTGQPVAANTALSASFRVGNSSTARKRISVLIIDSDFSDITVCTFWLAPGSPLNLYTMNTHTTKPWTNAAIYFYAATKGQDGGTYRLDDVSLSYQPALPNNRTDCVDPTAPPAPGGLDGPEWLSNGHFQVGGISGWSEFGSLTWQVEGGVFEFIRPLPLPNPAGVIFQATGQSLAAGDPITATFQLGNSSPIRKRVTVLLQDDDFTDLLACTFWLAPNQPLSSYGMLVYATRAWANARISFYAASVGGQTWTRIDNVTLRRTPGAAAFGTRCTEPAVSPLFESTGRAGSAAGLAGAAATGAGALGDGARNTAARDWTATDGFERVVGSDGAPGSRFRAARRGAGREVLYRTQPIDLTSATGATLSFESARTRGGDAEVQVSSDGIAWQTVGDAPEGRDRMVVDLSPFAGRVVYVRFVFTTSGPMDRPDADVWTIDNVSVDIRGLTAR